MSDRPMSMPMASNGGKDFLERPLSETPIDTLTQMFESQAKPDTQWYVGAEVELFTFHRETHQAADHDTIRSLLEALGDRLSMKPVLEVNGALIGLSGQGEAVSLEPGGQLEFASRPHRALKSLREETLAFTGALAELGRSRGLGFWAMGHQPFVDRDTSPVMPKPRYAIMREHLTGGRARDMMHLTGSVQVTVDFLDQKNLVNKVRTAAKVSPFLSALVAASPFTRGKPNGYKSMRYEIWRDTDAARCGMWPEMFDSEGLSARRYVERTLDTPAMFFRRGDTYVPSDKTTSFREYGAQGFQDTPVTVGDYLDHLTTFFPEIRPKGYVEMRGADCVLPEEAVAIAGFWRGLLDHEPTRQKVDERLAKMDFEAVMKLQPQVAKLGLAAVSESGPVLDLIRWLTKLSFDRLHTAAPDCAECVAPLVERAERGRSPADAMLEESSIEAALAHVELR